MSGGSHKEPQLGQGQASLTNGSREKRFQTANLPTEKLPLIKHELINKKVGHVQPRCYPKALASTQKVTKDGIFQLVPREWHVKQLAPIGNGWSLQSPDHLTAHDLEYNIMQYCYPTQGPTNMVGGIDRFLAEKACDGPFNDMKEFRSEETTVREDACILPEERDGVGLEEKDDDGWSESVWSWELVDPSDS